MIGLVSVRPEAGQATLSARIVARDSGYSTRKVHHWKPAMQVFQILFGEERVPVSA